MAPKAQQFDPTPRTEREKVFQQAAKWFYEEMTDWRTIALWEFATIVLLVFFLAK